MTSTGYRSSYLTRESPEPCEHCGLTITDNGHRQTITQGEPPQIETMEGTAMEFTGWCEKRMGITCRVCGDEKRCDMEEVDIDKPCRECAHFEPYLERDHGVATAAPPIAPAPQWSTGLKWRTDPLMDTDGDVLLFQVDLDDGKTDTYIGLVDEDGSMVDSDYGDDIGWRVESVSRWVLLSDVLIRIEPPR